MNSTLERAIKTVLSDEQDVREATRSHQREFPYDRDKESQVTRREFCNFLGLTSTAFLAGTVGFAAKSALDDTPKTMLPPHRIEGAMKLAPNSAMNFRFPTEKDPAILIRAADGSFHAFDQKCTHLLCPVFYEPKNERIECPCHEAGFEATTGNVLYGPPTRSLNRIVLEEHQGELFATGIITGGKSNERS